MKLESVTEINNLIAGKVYRMFPTDYCPHKLSVPDGIGNFTCLFSDKDKDNVIYLEYLGNTLTYKFLYNGKLIFLSEYMENYVNFVELE